MHRAERHEVARTDRLRPVRVACAKTRHVLACRYAAPILVEKVDHVGIAEAARQGEKKGHVVALDGLSNEALPAVIAGVVTVEHQPPVDVDEQNRVLVQIRDAQCPDAIGKWIPLAVGHCPNVEALFAQRIVDPLADMIRQKDGLAAQLLERFRLKMVGVTVRQPHILGIPDRRELFRRDLVREAPTAEIGAAGDPRIGDQDRRTLVVANQDGIANRIEADLHPRPSRVLPVGRLGLNADQPGVMTGRLTRGGSPAAAVGTATLPAAPEMSTVLQSTTKAMSV